MKFNFPIQKKTFLTLARLKNLFKKLIPNAQAFAAFTLAEVLITLAIIGVVASLTIPNLIKDYQRKQMGIHLKKAYSTINQALVASIADNGSYEGWNFKMSHTDFTNKYLKDYIPYAAFCIPQNCSKCNTCGSFKNHTSFLLKDGTRISIDGNSKSFYRFRIMCDKKTKNGTFSNNLFYFYLLKSGFSGVWSGTDIILNVGDGNFMVLRKGEKVKPMLYPEGYGYSVYQLINSGHGLCKFKDSGSASSSTDYMIGRYCSALIMKNNWEIPTKSEYIKMGGSAAGYPW